jgi:hypothetical protein
VALVIGLAVAVTGGPHRATGQQASAPGLPEYIAEFAPVIPNGGVTVRSTATGAVVATVAAPKVPAHGRLMDDAIAAAPDDRTFYIEYEASSAQLLQIWVFSFGITATGTVTPMTRIEGGVLNGVVGLGDLASLAVSPDGTELALTKDSTSELPDSRGYADQIVVIDLRTGAQRVWQGGMYRTDKVFLIPNLSWAADSRSLVFLALWCDGAPALFDRCSGADVEGEYRDTQVRSLPTDTAGGTLASGRLLLRQSARYPAIAQTIAGPDGSDLTMIVLSGAAYPSGAWQNLAIDHISATDGSLLGVDYQRGDVPVAEGMASEVYLYADPSGRFVLFTYPVPSRGNVKIGWVGDGTFHPLPFPSYDGQAVAW